MAQAFYDMLIEHLPRLRASAIRMTRNRSDADDVLQETALKALRAESQFAPGTNFGAWIYRILRNEFISSCRRAKRPAVSIDEVPDDVLARRGAQESRYFCTEVMCAMDSLRDTEREALILVCAGGLSYEEAAERLMCSVGTVKSRLWRARTSLGKILFKDDENREQTIRLY
ncbi:MAG: sigma-70 family RNA polymerase sigma factor [Rhodospirillaceae bacterium]|nr:MAG: sigma-70 family RNA polymerase sigma factor [Rhodospirillaceae bacterium]